MNRIKVWPHITLMVVAVAVIAAVGVGFWMKQEQTASAEELPYAARIQRVDGEVAFSDSLPNTSAADPNAEWIAATPNQPFSEGDRIYTRDKSHPRSRLADAISRASIKTLHSMLYRWETAGLSSRSATARQCLKSAI